MVIQRLRHGLERLLRELTRARAETAADMTASRADLRVNEVVTARSTAELARLEDLALRVHIEIDPSMWKHEGASVVLPADDPPLDELENNRARFALRVRHVSSIEVVDLARCWAPQLNRIEIEPRKSKSYVLDENGLSTGLVLSISEPGMFRLRFTVSQIEVDFIRVR
jgi:hypothetical protein